MSKALVVGGNSGIGLAISLQLVKNGYECVYIWGLNEIQTELIPEEDRTLFSEKTTFFKKNLLSDDLSDLDKVSDIDTLVLTIGFGRVALLENLTEPEVSNLLYINFNICVKIIKHFYYKISSPKSFFTSVFVSIAGHVVSPFFSVYGASKNGLRAFIENTNSELAASNSTNRILDVSPGHISGTSFSGQRTDLSLLVSLAKDVIAKMYLKDTLFIPDYNEIYKRVIDEYHSNPELFAGESYKYKLNGGRISNKPQVVIGYLSGTFDLFHIGHLNLIQRAKANCDYLIVGVHESGSWKKKETFIPLVERKQIVASIRFVDQVVDAPIEDSDAWQIYKYNKLFVGSDYQGTDRFKRYELILKGKAEIVYFPYTKETSSTQIRAAIKANNNINQ